MRGFFYDTTCHCLATTYCFLCSASNLGLMNRNPRDRASHNRSIWLCVMVVASRNPAMLSDNSVDALSSNRAAIISIEPGKMPASHAG